MKSLTITTPIFLLLICTLTVGAIPTFTVIGNVTDAEEQPTSDGLVVIVENASRSLSKQTKTGANTKSGSYAIAFIANDDKPVAQAGDTLNFTVKNSEDKILCEKTYQISEEDIKQTKTQVLLQLKAASSGEDVGKTSPVFVVGGEVTDEKGDSVVDALTVTVRNETLSLTQETKLGQNTKPGSYLVTFIATDKDTEFVVQTGDTLKVTLKDASGNTLIQQSHLVNDDEIANTRAVINLQIEGEVEAGPATTVELIATPNSLPANGESKATLKATVKDSKGLLVKDETVTMKITAGGGMLSTVTNNGNGTYSAKYTAGTAVGTVTVSATTSNNVSDTVDITLEDIPTVDPIRSTIVATSPTTANGSAESTITVTLLSSSDEPISGKKVAIEVSGSGNTVTPSESVTDNKGVAIFKVRSTVAESKQVTATDVTDNITLSKKAVILFQPGLVKYVTVKASDSELPADGKSPATITITVEDENHNPVPDAQVKIILTGSGNIPEDAVHEEGGTYKAIYTAGEAEGKVTITATVGAVSGETEITLMPKPTLFLMLEPDSGSVGTTVKATGEGFEPNTSVGELKINEKTVSVVGIGTVVAGSNIRTDSEGKFVVKFKVPKQPGGRVSVTVGEAEAIFDITARIISVSPESDVAGTNITLIGDGFAKREEVRIDFGETGGIGSATTQDDGSFETTFDADVQKSGVKQIKVSGDLSERKATVDFELLKSIAKTIDITAEPTDITADGVSTAILTVTVKDDGGRAVIEEDVTITPLSGEATFATHQGDGIYTATYTSGTKAGKVKILATTSNSLTTDTEVTLVHDEAYSVTVEANPSGLSGDGEDDSTITATVKDAHGNLVFNEEVTMTMGGAGGTLKNDEEKTGTTVIASNAGDGTYIATYISAEITQEQEMATVRAITKNKVEGEVEIALSRTPDFSLNAEETTKENVQPGAPLIYFIKVTGQNGFNLPVELETKGLPEGVKPTFSPGEVTPTVEEPEVDSQLELDIPETIEQGEYPFIVRGISSIDDDWLMHTLDLSFTVEKIPSNISVVVNPKEVRLRESIMVSGQVLLQTNDERTDLEIQLSYQFDDETPIERTVIAKGAQKEYTDELAITDDVALNKLGVWKVKACWKGDNKYQSVCRETSFTVSKGKGTITLKPSVGIPQLGEKVTITVKLLPELREQPISLEIISPGGDVDKPENIKTGELGILQYEFTPAQRGDYTCEAAWSGNDNYEPASSKITITAVKEPAKTIIVLGGGDETTNQHWLTFDRIAQHVYKTFKRCHNQEYKDIIDDEYIFFLSPSKQASDIIDKPTSAEWLKYAITEWAKERVNKYVPLCIYLISHNRGDKFLLAKGDEDVYLTPEMLDEWLNVLPDDTPVIIVIEACYSGKFITKTSNGNPVLSKYGRTIITSANEEERAELLGNKSSFSKFFFDAVEKNQDVLTAFFEASETISYIPQHRHQKPQLDANGNGTPNEEIDYALLGQTDAKKRIYIPDEGICAGEPPEIEWVKCEPEILKEGETKATIRANIYGLDVSNVLASITPPVYDESNLDTSYDEIVLLDKGGGVYEAEYDKFTSSGNYTIVVNAKNPEGDAMPKIAILTVEGTCPADVNGDGSVDISDLVLVGINFGKTGVNIKGDVNGDDSVDIIDLILVGRNFGESCLPRPQ